MNPVALWFADGSAFFAGLTLVLATGVLFLRFGTHRVGRPVLAVLLPVGLLTVAASGTPLPLWLYLLWAAPAVAIPFMARKAGMRRLGVGACVWLAAATGVMLVLELPHRAAPQIKVTKGSAVYVIGDSLSAGMFERERSWPVVLGGRVPLRVVNLARPGATLQSARLQAGGIMEPGSLASLEIGGIDFLEMVGADRFQERLEALVLDLHRRGCRILMFELPLPPFWNAYGRAQRDVARANGVMLLPKHGFASVLGADGATSDGLHFSPAGHEAVAALVAGVITVQ